MRHCPPCSRYSNTSGITIGCSRPSACCRSHARIGRPADCTWPGIRSPLLITADAARELQAPVSLPPGISQASEWPSAQVDLGAELVSADVHRRAHRGQDRVRGPERLGSDGLIRLIEKERAQNTAAPVPDRQANERLIDAVITRARELNGGDLDDDLAVLVLSCADPAGS